MATYKRVKGLAAPTIAATESAAGAFGCIHESGRSPSSNQGQAIAADHD